MEFLGFLIIGLAIAILVLPFLALRKANRAKRVVQDLVRRVASLENELHNLRPQTVSPVQEARVTAPEPKVEVVPPAILPMTPAPAVSKVMAEPPPIPQDLLAPK